MTTPRSTRVAFWAAFTRILTIAIFAQSFFAGVFLSGELWGRDAHRVNASIAVTVRGLPPLVPYMTPSTTSGVLSLTVSPGTGADHAARNCATLAGVMLDSGE